MDVSKLVWLAVILAIVGLGWLATSPGVNYLYNKYTSSTPGQDADVDKSSEAGLSRLGGFMMTTFRYEKALQCYKAATDRYPTGKNYWYNAYQMARCYEKLDQVGPAADVLRLLMEANADAKDERVPSNQQLNLRLEKIIELNELEAR